ncbi:hypothetical protein K437DRAFT_172681 [Tilletiaria anomala UBC 951]|uniref:Uncharacterized protein n=1 Tax=Tilletiaria anomala (strain ATCC 24038 / CBS 436.72 / UBC 951) TaxID=1037660 RepID=A0A066VRT9_TILAU|nr:uncharacterized protein K437DRAFT_172681 [Tilletiaria anomala UBC 951]KDN41514.1 hypothetical protein K437DRAFT_172681 [Tilletiaria anomala UBC 951]
MSSAVDAEAHVNMSAISDAEPLLQHPTEPAGPNAARAATGARIAYATTFQQRPYSSASEDSHVSPFSGTAFDRTMSLDSSNTTQPAFSRDDHGDGALKAESPASDVIKQTPSPQVQLQQFDGLPSRSPKATHIALVGRGPSSSAASPLMGGTSPRIPGAAGSKMTNFNSDGKEATYKRNLRANPFEAPRAAANTSFTGSHSRSPSSHYKGGAAGAPERGIASAVSVHRSVYPASSTYFLTVIPPADLPSDPPHPRSGSSAGVPSHFRRGCLLPLYPTLGGQLYTIAREYGLPSIGGLAIYLVDDGEGNLGPCIGEAAWRALWSRYFEEDARLDFFAPEGIDAVGSPLSMRSPQSQSPALFAGTCAGVQSADGRDEGFSTESEQSSAANANARPHQSRVGYSHNTASREGHSRGHSHPNRCGTGSSTASPAQTHGMAFGLGRLPIVGRIEWAIETHRAHWWPSWVEEAENSFSSGSTSAGGSAIRSAAGGGGGSATGRRTLHLKSGVYERSPSTQKHSMVSRLLRKGIHDPSTVQPRAPSDYAASRSSQPRSATSATRSFEQSISGSEEQISRSSSAADDFSQASLSASPRASFSAPHEVSASRHTSTAGLAQQSVPLDGALPRHSTEELDAAGYAPLLEEDDGDELKERQENRQETHQWQSFEDIPDTDEGMWQELSGRRHLGKSAFPEAAAYADSAQQLPLSAAALSHHVAATDALKLFESNRKVADDLGPTTPGGATSLVEEALHHASPPTFPGEDEEAGTEEAPSSDDVGEVLALWASSSGAGSIPVHRSELLEPAQSELPTPAKPTPLASSSGSVGTAMLQSPISLDTAAFPGQAPKFADFAPERLDLGTKTDAESSLKPLLSPTPRSSTGNSADLSDSLGDMERALELLSPTGSSNPRSNPGSVKSKTRFSTGSKRVSAAVPKFRNLSRRSLPASKAPSSGDTAHDTPRPGDLFLADDETSSSPVPVHQAHEAMPLSSALQSPQQIPAAPASSTVAVLDAPTAEPFLAQASLEPASVLLELKDPTNDKPGTVVAETPPESVELDEQVVQQSLERSAGPEGTPAAQRDPQLFSSPEHNQHMTSYDATEAQGHADAEPFVQERAAARGAVEMQQPRAPYPSSESTSQSMSDLLSDYHHLSSKASQSDSSGHDESDFVQPLAGENDPFGVSDSVQATPLARQKDLDAERLPASSYARAQEAWMRKSSTDDGFESAIQQTVQPQMTHQSPVGATSPALHPASMHLAERILENGTSPAFASASISQSPPPTYHHLGSPVVEPEYKRQPLHMLESQGLIQQSAPSHSGQSGPVGTAQPEIATMAVSRRSSESEEWSQDGSLEEHGRFSKASEFEIVPGTPTFLYEQHLAGHSRPDSLASHVLSARDADGLGSASPLSRPSPLRETHDPVSADDPDAPPHAEGAALGLDYGPHQRFLSQDGSSIHSSEDFDGRLDDMLDYAARLPQHPAGFSHANHHDDGLDLEQMTISTRQAVRQALSESHERASIDSVRSLGLPPRSPTSPIAMEAWPRRSSGSSISGGNYPRRGSVERGSPLAGSQPRRSSSSHSPARRFGELPPSPALTGIKPDMGTSAGSRRGSATSPLNTSFKADWLPPLPADAGSTMAMCAMSSSPRTMSPESLPLS